MRTMTKKVLRDESGKILILVLVLLVVGGLLLTPLLGLMSTGLMAGQVYEKKAAELYAADAGVQEAVWRISHNITGDGELFPLNVNERDVEYAIQSSGCGSKRRYIVTSTAYTDGISGTTVTADIYGFSFPDNAITSRETVYLSPNSYVEGNVQYGKEKGLTEMPGAIIDGERKFEQYENWPSSDELYDDYYYPRYVGSETNFEYRSGNDTVKVSAYPALHPTHPSGPLHWTGNLEICNKEDSVPELRLNGTLYVDGNLDFAQPSGSNKYTLDLNGYTIFVEGSIDFPSNHITVKGTGNIIAVGDIDFQPGIDGSDGRILLLSLKGSIHFQPNGQFTGFVMSVEKTVTFKPNGEFRGSVAGNVDVDLDSKVRVIYQSAIEADIDFPFESFANWRIRSYNIS